MKEDTHKFLRKHLADSDGLEWMDSSDHVFERIVYAVLKDIERRKKEQYEEKAMSGKNKNLGKVLLNNLNLMVLEKDLGEIKKAVRLDLEEEKNQENSPIEDHLLNQYGKGSADVNDLIRAVLKELPQEWVRKSSTGYSYLSGNIFSFDEPGIYYQRIGKVTETKLLEREGFV